MIYMAEVIVDALRGGLVESRHYGDIAVADGTGKLIAKVGEEERIMWEGDVLTMPPGVGHSFTGIGPALILEVSMPSILQDNFFADREIGEDGVI